MDTKTYEDWSKYVGMKPHNFGVVARYYTNNTLNFITDGLRNVYTDGDKSSKFLVTSSMIIEYQVETNNIKHVEYAQAPEGTGEGGQEITFYFKENYYQKYDIFRDDITKLQFQVVARPIRKRDDLWELQCRLIDNNYDSVIDESEYLPGNTTTFQSVAFTELSEEGKGSSLALRIAA